MDEFDMVNILSDLQNQIDSDIAECDENTLQAINLLILAESANQVAAIYPQIAALKPFRNILLAADSLSEMFTEDEISRAAQMIHKVYLFAEDVREKYES